MKAYKHILVPTDGSALSLKAAKAAVALAKAIDAKLTALYVIPLWYPTLGAEGMRPDNQADLEQAYLKSKRAQAHAAIAAIEKMAAIAAWAWARFDFR